MSCSDSDEDPFGIGIGEGDVIEDEDETTRPPLCDSRLLELLVLEGATAEIDAALQAAEAGASSTSTSDQDEWTRVQIAVAKMAQQLVTGQYPDLLRESEAALFLLGAKAATETDLGSDSDYIDFIRSRAMRYVQGEVSDVGGTAETELVRQCRATATLFVGAAALQLFAQANYTGPTLEPAVLTKIEPYLLFGEQIEEAASKEPSKQDPYTQVHDGGNAAELLGDKKAVAAHSTTAFNALEVDGEIPYPLAEIPCQLLVAHSLIQALAQPQQHAWGVTCPIPPPGPPIPMLPLGMDDEQEEAIREHYARNLLEFTISQRQAAGEKRIGSHHNGMAPSSFTDVVSTLCTRCWWHARAALAHERLLLVRTRTHTLWMGVKQAFLRTYEEFGLPVMHTTAPSTFSDRSLALARCFTRSKYTEVRQIELTRRLCVRLHLEYGLSQHFFQHPNKGKFQFGAAKEGTGLRVELTGAMGRRTKFQQTSHAQLVLMAASQPPLPPDELRALQAREAASESAASAETSVGSAPDDDAGGDYAGRKGGLKLSGMASVIGQTWEKDSVLTNEQEESEAPAAAGKGKGKAEEQKGVDGQINFDHGRDALPAMIHGEVTGTLKGANQAVNGEEAVEPGEEEEGGGSSESAPVMTASGREVEDDEMVTLREVGHDALDEYTALLEGIAFDDDSKYRSAGKVAAEKMTVDGKLDVLDQAILLALCLDVSNSNPADGLTNEEMRPYLDRVLANPLNWMVYSTALLERAWLECEVSRTRDRAVLQMQALVDQHTTRLTMTQNSTEAIEDAAPAEERVAFLHSLAFPPRWELQRDLADRYRSLGVIGSAKVIYEELQMWDDTVECYTLLDQRNRAETIIRKELTRRPTPTMWCCLGDIKEGIEQLRCYERAWVLSDGRLARAKRSLGRHFFDMKPTDPIAERVLAGAYKDFDGKDDPTEEEGEGNGAGAGAEEQETSEAMSADRLLADDKKKVRFNAPVQRGNQDREVLVARSKRLLKLSLLQMLEATKVAPLYIAAWFLQGVIAMRIEEWNVALKSFARVVSLDLEQGEAWGNMGGIHMRQGDFGSAVTCLQNGLREKRSSWQMWENLIVCCVECKRYGDAMAAIREHVMLGERQSHSRSVDVQALRDLVQKLVIEKYVTDEKEKEETAAAKEVAVAVKLAAAAPDEDSVGNVAALNADVDGEGENDEAEDNKEKVALAEKQGNENMCKRLGELLEWIVQRVPSDWKLWDTMGMYYLGCGRAKRGLECYLSESRALQSGDGAKWESDEEAFKKVVTVAAKVVHVYLTLGKQQGSAKLVHAAGMYLRGIQGKAKANLSDTEAFKHLTEVVAEVEAAKATFS
jgi:tetratricopeptide (TPR) repeat protein